MTTTPVSLATALRGNQVETTTSSSQLSVATISRCNNDIQVNDNNNGDVRNVDNLIRR